MTTTASPTTIGGNQRALPVWLARLGHRVFRDRDLLFPLVLGATLLGVRPILLGGDPRLDLLADAIGLLIATIGQLLRALVIGLAYIKRGGKNRRVYAKALVQEGLFAHCRNPLYLGNVLVISGLTIIHGSPVVIALVIPTFCLVYLAIVAAEEEYLLGRFGADYERYRDRVPRFVPSVRGIDRTVRGMTFDWRRVLRSEYGSTATWTATAMLLLQWELIRNPGAPAAIERTGPVTATIGLIGLAWMASRHLKKTGRLDS